MANTKSSGNSGNKSGTGNAGAARMIGNVAPTGSTYSQVTSKREGGKKGK